MLGLSLTYFIVFSLLAFVSVLIFRVRRTLLGTDLGINRIFIGASLILYGILAWFRPNENNRQMTRVQRPGSPSNNHICQAELTG
jgi:hypothetical protein